MAGLVRFRSIQNIISRLTSTSRLTVKQASSFCRTNNQFLTLHRNLSTSSSQKSENVSKSDEIETKCEAKEVTKKNWVSYGYNHESQELDKHMMHITMFMVVTLIFVCGGFVLVYLPDFREKDWALREAYIRLREREAQGLPPISPDVVDPAVVILPTDEELGDREIII